MKNIKVMLCILVAFVVASCNDEEPARAQLQIRLTDSPGSYEEVNVDIQDVLVSNSEEDTGWLSLANINRGVYNLLDFTNGADTLLADASIPVGEINQVRLVLGENNTVKIGGEIFDLDTPSGQQSGLKIKLQIEIIEGVDYKVILDFDAAKSVVKAGNSGKYNLKPVIRAFLEAENGSIAGTIEPKEVNTVISAILGTDTISTYSNEEGNFLLGGMEPGTYDVLIRPDTAYDYNNKHIKDVTVLLGQKTELGTVPLED